MHPAEVRVRRSGTSDLAARDLHAIRALLDTAFAADGDERFSEDDWQHALGGLHFLAERAGHLVGHASVVERELHVAGQPIPTGYVEAVATHPAWQRRGIGSLIMGEVGRHLEERYALGALGTGSHGFYARLGWMTWRGPSSVRTAAGDVPTPEEDGHIMVLPTPSSPRLDLSAPISCDWREGDVW